LNKAHNRQGFVIQESANVMHVNNLPALYPENQVQL
jgi:hypothetical protein